MLIDILLYVASLILGTIGGIIVFISNGWSIWPSAVLNGFTYFFQKLMTFNIILPIDQWLLAFSTMIKFDVIYVSTKLILKLINWVRGAGGVELN